MVDFTGGVGERKDLTKKNEIPGGLFNRMLHDYSMNSLMGSSIHVCMNTSVKEVIIIITRALGERRPLPQELNSWNFKTYH